MSTPGNAAKQGTTLSNIQTAQSSQSLVGIETTMHQSAYYLVSALAHPTLIYLEHCLSI